jgi:hypothetical protein
MGSEPEEAMQKLLPFVLLILIFCTSSTQLFGQTVPAGWMGGAQSSGFPTPLTLASPRSLEQTTGQTQSQPQALPSVPATNPQPNPSTGQTATPPSGAATDQSAASATAATASDTSFLKEVQAGITAMSPGKFGDTKYKWYGFVRLDSIFDFNPIGSTDDFVTSSIPVPPGRGQNYVLTPRYTRLGFDTSTPWKAMDWTINTKIEMDFFNGNTSGLFGSFPLRLRFAYIDFGPFRVGQAASLFMDYDVFPDVLDYEGPPGMVLMRQPVASIKWSPTDRLTVTVGVEQPYSDISWDDGTGAGFVTTPGTGIITTPGVPRNVQDVPDFTGNVRYKYEYGHVQVAGIARKLTYQPALEEADSKLGYGVNVTGTFHPWVLLDGCVPCEGGDKTPLQKSRFLGQYATGRGINRYIQDINGLGLDAVFEPVNGFDTLRSNGWFFCYEHFWTDKWISNFCYGQSWTELADAMPDTTYRSAKYLAANLIWLPVERMGIGLEYLIGERENKNGETGLAHRVQAGIQYKF